MYPQLLFIQNKAIKQLITQYLDVASGNFTNNGKIAGIEVKKVPVYQGGYNQKILYISKVELGISKSHNSPAMEISQIIATVTKDIAQYLSQHSNHLFSIKIVPPGEIHLQLFDSTLAAWLQTLIISPQTRDFVNNYADHLSPNCFTIQYVHARCCSLLRQGHQEGLIQCTPTPAGIENSVQSIPWLDGDQKLYLQHIDESFLIYQLVRLVDNLAITNYSSINWEKAGEKLSQAFEKFWGSCRIWGEVKINSLELAQARLGLVMATQLVLKSLLEDKLGIIAPREL
ncbi:MAG: DALR anticodon-binding domain-containing protein [Cuspidothrix sp.]